MKAAADPNPASADSKPKHGNKAAWGAMLAGAALSVYGWTRKSTSGAALGLAGGAIALKAASAGPIADLVGTETAMRHSVTVMATASEIYPYLKKTGSALLWMGGIRELSSKPKRETSGIGSIPKIGSRDAELQIIEDVPAQLMRWQFVDCRRNSRDCVAELRLTPLPADRGTQVTLTLSYKLHTGILHSGAPRSISPDPGRAVRESLRKLKMLIEAGEIATIEGQSHGPRALRGKLIGALMGAEVA